MNRPPSDGKARRQAERRGRRAETLAALALTLKGYRILARNVRLPIGEIDLIAGRGKLLVFVEVKARGDLDAACHAVSPGAWRRIAATAQAWAGRYDPGSTRGWRFDLMAVLPGRYGLPRLHHMRDAWRPDFA